MVYVCVHVYVCVYGVYVCVHMCVWCMCVRVCVYMRVYIVYVCCGHVCMCRPVVDLG